MQGYQQQPYQQPHVTGRPQLNEGVVGFMNGVYAWMTAGLAVTAGVAYGISQSPQALLTFFNPHGGMTGLGWVALLAPLGLVLIFGGRLMTMGRGAATALFMVLAVCYGVTFSLIPLLFSAGAIFKAFFITMGMFAATAAFGFFTKKDLTGIGQFLIMALFGVIIASLVNGFFVKSAGAFVAIDFIIVLIFAGLTAYDTQKLKQIYLMHGAVGNIAIVGALNLYLDFINMFRAVLYLMNGNND